MTLYGALPIDQWDTPASKYPLRTVGTARLRRSIYTRGYYPYWGIDGIIYYQVLHPIEITELQLLSGLRWQTWMVDDPPHLRSMQIYAEEAGGRVLVGGLGLGLVCHELAENPLVDEIVVVELNPDVISLMQPLIPPEVNVVQGDFFNYVVNEPGKWGVVIVDLWVTGSAEEKRRAYLQEVVPLNRRIRERHPNAQVTFHGFHTVSDVQVITPEAMQFIEQHRPYGES